MKNFLTSKLGLSVIAATLLANAPSQAAGLVSYSLNAGIGYGTQAAVDSGGTTVASTYKMGYLFGGGVDIGAGPFGVMANVLYAMRSFDQGSSIILKTNRLEIPVVARFGTGLLTFMAGGYWAMLMGDAMVEVAGAAGVAATGVKTSDYGATAGVGISLPAGVGKFHLDLRYNLGLANLQDAPTGQQSVKVRTIDLLAGFSF